METIVKNQDAAANALIDPYLTWAQGQWWHANHCDTYLYEKFRLRDANGDNNRQRLLEEVLLPEQHNRCCYCMRHIADHTDDASIEHIAPQHTATQVTLNCYFSARSGGLNSRNVCLTADYVRRGTVGAPYPHHVAYHNFAVACRQCNSSRMHHEIEPLFLFPDIHTEVVYNQYSGEAEWIYDPAYTKPDPELPTLEKIKLNRPLLKAIRSLWFYIKRNGLSPTGDNRRELIYGALGDSLNDNPAMSNDDFNAYLDLNTAGTWDVFLKYSYFGQ